MNKSNQKGFTLIEICIVTIIVGIMLVGAIQAYTIYNEKQQIERMNTQMVNLDQAIQAFSAAEGRLPCPGPINGSSAGNGYNSEECTGAHGVIEVAGTNGGRVLIGKYPAATLGIDSSNMKDVYGNYLIYAVTKESATSGGDVTGAIRVIEEGVDEDSSSPTEGQIIEKNTHDSVQYVVLSLGKTGKGAFAYDGSVLNPCVGTEKEVENCDMNNPVFLSSVQSDAQANLFYDDRVVFKNKSAAVSNIPNLLKPAMFGKDIMPKGNPYRIGTDSWTTRSGNDNDAPIMKQDYEIKTKGYLEHTVSSYNSSGAVHKNYSNFGTGIKIKLKESDTISIVDGRQTAYMEINGKRLEIKKVQNKDRSVSVSVNPELELVDSTDNFIYSNPTSDSSKNLVHFSVTKSGYTGRGDDKTGYSQSEGFGYWVHD